MRAVVLACVLLALGCVSVAASGDACNGDDYGSSGQFDYYVFQQSWPAQFCSDHSSWPGCSNPTSWQSRNLSLHGMWPNYNQKVDGHFWPQCCGDSQYGSDLDYSVAQQLLPAWKVYWPNEEDPSPSRSGMSDSLWAHEWQKHGTCSGLDQKTYFTEAMSIQLSMGTPDTISSNIGGSVALSDLQSSFKMDGCSRGSDCWTGLTCTGSSGNQYLASVTTCWSTNFQRIMCPAATLTGKFCSDDSINILSF